MSTWWWNFMRKYYERKVVKYSNALLAHSGGASRVTLACARGIVIIEHRS